MQRAPRLLLTLLGLICLAGGLQAQTTLTRRDIIKNLRIPVDLVWGRDDWLWILELGGRVLRVDPSTLEAQEIFQVPDVYIRGESGALGMAIHPDSNVVYIAYNYYEEGEARLKLVRYRWDGEFFIEPRVLVSRISATTGVTGGRLLITSDKKLMMTCGDLEPNSLAQSHWFLNGKTLRMNLDGTKPADNPYPNAASPVNLIWTTGQRDVRGLARTTSGVVFEAEQGRDSSDELNVVTRRRNYGWPRVFGNCDAASETKFCRDSSVVEPVRLWRQQIFPGGMDYYDSPAIPEWRGCLLMATLDQMDLRALRVSGSSITAETIFHDQEFGRLRDVCVAPDGRVFVATSNRDEKGVPIAKIDDDRIVEIGGNVALAVLGTPAVSRDVSGVFRAGDSVLVAFPGQNFNGGNVFTVEMSDASGSFARPTVIGRLSDENGGSIAGRIPCVTPAGAGYQFRVTTSSPSKFKIAPGTYTVIPAPPASIAPRGPISFCPGDSAVLRGTPGGDNRWSTGQRADSVVVAAAGTYWVALVTNGCPTYSDTVTVTLNPVPAPTISLVAGNLLDAGAGYSRYEWYLDDTLQTEAARSLIAKRSGRYRVRVQNALGCWGTSADFAHELVAGIAAERTPSVALRIVPQPVRDRFQLTAVLPARGQVTVSIVDQVGRVVFETTRTAAAGQMRREIDASRLSPGTYVVRLQLGGHEIGSSVIIKR